MSGIQEVSSTLFALALVSVSATAMAGADEIDTSLRMELDRIAQRRIFFGHQSVGVNLLDGINKLAATADAHAVRIAEVESASAVTQAMIGHALIAENENPLKKIKSFEQVMGTKASGIDIALMKFCYVDFTAETDVKALFARYRASIESLRSQHPGTTFVHVTAPLTTVEGRLKAKVKYMLGYAPLYGTLENMRREEYNTLLRQAYQGREPIFDLARVEATAADGTVKTVSWKGSVVPVMVPEYSDDGGHLNEIGRRLAARELVSVLARIPNRATVR